MGAVLMKNFIIRLVYFKPSGKFYTESNYEFESKRQTDGNGPIMSDVVAQVRGWRDCGGQGSLPGLSAYSDGWDGPILIDCEEGYPCLLMPTTYVDGT